MRRQVLRILAGAALLLQAALFPSPSLAIHSVQVDTHRIDDVNGNGLADCGEAVIVEVLLSDPSAPAGSVVQGQVTIPYSAISLPQHWSYATGLQLNSSSACTFTVVTDSTLGVYDYTCAPTSSPGYSLSVLARGHYSGPSGGILFTVQDQVTAPAPATRRVAYSEGRTGNCGVADLRLTKTDGGASAHPGMTVAYTLNYTNLGNIQASGSVLNETVPANTSFNPTASSAGWLCSPSNGAGSSCTLSLGSIPTGGSGSRIFAVDVPASAPPSAPTLSNTASITTTAPDPDLANNVATDSTPFVPGTPDLALTKTVSASGGTPGSTVVFTLGIENAGDGVAQAVVLDDPLPANASFLSSASSPGWTCSAGVCRLNLGDLNPGASISRVFAVTVVQPFPANQTAVSNTACAATSTPGDAPANNCASASAPIAAAPILSLTKSRASGSAAPGGSLVFDLAVTNAGNQDAAGVTLTETVPAHTTFSAAGSSPGWSCASPAAGATCTLTLASLPGGGGSATRQFAVTISNPLPAGVASIANQACAGVSASSDCDSVEVSTKGSAMLSFTKQVASGTATPGEVLVYALRVQNTGNQGSAPFALSETVPNHTTFDPAGSSPGWACSGPSPGATCSISITTLAGGGASLSRAFALRIDQPLPAGVTQIANTACLDSAGAPADCDSVAVPPNASPSLGITKVLTSGAPNPGQLLVFTITVQNTGNQDAGPVTISDPVPGLTHFSPTDSSLGWSCSSSVCQLTLPGLSAGGTAAVQIGLRLAPSFPAGAVEITNTACASDDPMRNVCASAEVALGGAAALSLEKTYTGPPLAAGATLPFTLTVRNTGDREASDVRLREIVPANTTFLASQSDPRWSCDSIAAGSACVLDLQNLGAGGQASVTFAVVAPSPLPDGVVQIANAACLESAGGGSLACSDVSTPLEVQVEATLDDALLTDTNDNQRLDRGDVLRYTLVVTNPSGRAATSLLVKADLDSHLTLVAGSVTTSAGTVVADPHRPMIEVDQLEAGASVTVVFDAVAENVPPGLRSLASQGSVEGADFDTELTDDPATPEDDDPTVTPLDVQALHAIPTLGEIGLASLVLLLAGGALLTLRRRPALRG